MRPTKLSDFGGAEGLRCFAILPGPRANLELLAAAGDVLPAETANLSEDDLREFLGARLAAFKVPARFIWASEALPRLGTGKIDRVALKARYAA